MPQLPRVDRDEDGRPVWVHWCTDGAPDFDGEIHITLPLGPTGWEWTQDGGLTPSVLCRNCGVHGFWMGGESPHFRHC